MIRDTYERNQSVAPNDFEINRIRRLMPEYFDTKGNFMIDKLQAALQEHGVDLTKEGYELRFLGKSYAKYLTSTASEAVVVPDIANNNKIENKTSGNLYLVGDNIDALKYLLHSYSGQIKCIYIDPPYNTGNDGFVYDDDFGFTIDQLVNNIGLEEAEAERVLDLRGKSSHSAWLTFMYPRLEIAKQLLTDDGVIFISIDENELSNLLAIGSEIFGPSNEIATFIWQKKKGGGNDSVYIAVEHEYVVMFARDANALEKISTPYDADYLKRYKEQDEYGKFYWDTFRRKSGKQYYPITLPDGTVLENDENGTPISWLRSEKRFKQDLAKGEVRFVQKDDGTWSVQFKQRLPEGKKPRSILREVGTTSTGGEDVAKLFGQEVFDNPKPVDLIAHLISIVADKNDTVLDFFSGSASTAEAVLNLNSRDGGERKFIVVQRPEVIVPKPNAPASRNAVNMGYTTVDQIGRDRIRLAGQTLNKTSNADIDYGFTLYRLEKPTQKTIDALLSFDPEQDEALFSGDFVEKMAFGDTPGRETILTTWLVEDGYGFNPPIRRVELHEYFLEVCHDSAYVIEPGLSSRDLVNLIGKIEANELKITRIVVLGYSVEFSVMHELKKNLSTLKSGRVVKVIERL